jgi:hypothetical protein
MNDKRLLGIEDINIRLEILLLPLITVDLALTKDLGKDSA